MHSCLQPQSRLYSPTRLLSVGTEGDSAITLVATKSPDDEPYATLSYCWGSGNPIKLLGCLVTEFQRGIQIDSLPCTLQEAVYVSRGLGLKYVWIDALCIIQDSPEDWNHESAQMADIYSNSYCNLAATSTDDCQGGLIRTRNPDILRTTVFNTNWKGACNGPIGLTDRYLFTRNVDEAPLNGRGWVVQERLLSPRTLHFGKDQLFWECYKTNACESYPHGVMPGCEAPLSKHDLTIPHSPGDLYEYWGRVVRSFTLSRLTKEKDKLPAISGLARRLAPVLSDDYVAGLWRNRLSHELLWFPTRAEEKLRAYRGPSWSWVSIEGEILTGPSPNTLDSEAIVIQDVHSTDIDFLSGDRFGQVCSAVLRLSGKLYPAVVATSPDGHADLIFDDDGLNAAARLDPGLGMLDVITETGESLGYCMPILVYGNKGGWGRVQGLILEATGKTSGEYKRIGSFFTEQDELVSIMGHGGKPYIADVNLYDEYGYFSIV